MPAPASTLTPQALAHKLINSGCNLEELLEDFAADARQIAEILYSRQFQDHLKLRLDLALAQARLQAAEFLPACTGKLLRLTDAEKPEVARRSIMALMGITGLPTRVTPAPAPTPDAHPAPGPNINQNPNDSALLSPSP